VSFELRDRAACVFYRGLASAGPFEVASLLNEPVMKVKEELDTLVLGGELQRVGTGMNGRYSLVQPLPDACSEGFGVVTHYENGYVFR